MLMKLQFIKNIEIKATSFKLLLHAKFRLKIKYR